MAYMLLRSHISNDWIVLFVKFTFFSLAAYVLNMRAAKVFLPSTFYKYRKYGIWYFRNTLFSMLHSWCVLALAVRAYWHLDRRNPEMDMQFLRIRCPLVCIGWNMNWAINARSANSTHTKTRRHLQFTPICVLIGIAFVGHTFHALQHEL